MTLEEKFRDTLARLSVLSEANAGALEPRTSQSKSDSKAPPGFKPGLDTNRCPPKERSLYDWYRWNYEHLDPEDLAYEARLLKLWLGAERDYHTRVLNFGDGRPGTTRLTERRRSIRAGLHIARDDEGEDAMPAWPAPAPLKSRGYDDHAPREIPGADDEKEAARQVCEIYEGQSAEEAAYFENVTVEVIRKARKLFKRNQDDGRPVPPFREWDDEERRRQINLLLAAAKHRGEILGAKSIAKHFGVDKNTVKPYMERPAVAA